MSAPSSRVSTTSVRKAVRPDWRTWQDDESRERAERREAQRRVLLTIAHKATWR